MAAVVLGALAVGAVVFVARSFDDPTMPAEAVATKDPVSSRPSRLTVEKPASVNVTVYAPGLRFSMRYWPVPSVTVVRTFSSSAGLAASTVTPGSTPPDASRTTPVIEACANAAAGASTKIKMRAVRCLRMRWASTSIRRVLS